MVDQVETLVTPEMIKAPRHLGTRRNIVPYIPLSDIRKFAIAIYWPKRRHRGCFGTRNTPARRRWGGIIAPQDFNPFAWPIKNDDPADRGAGGSRPRERRGMNGGQIDTYFQPMRPDDVIRARHRVRDWNDPPDPPGPDAVLLHGNRVVEPARSIGEAPRPDFHLVLKGLQDGD